MTVDSAVVAITDTVVDTTDGSTDDMVDDTQVSSLVAHDMSADAEIQLAAQGISELRATIDRVDEAIIELLADRFEATERIGILKAQAGFAPTDSSREAEQRERFEQVAVACGLAPRIAQEYREFVVSQAKKRHYAIREAQKSHEITGAGNEIRME